MKPQRETRRNAAVIDFVQRGLSYQKSGADVRENLQKLAKKAPLPPRFKLNRGATALS